MSLSVIETLASANKTIGYFLQICVIQTGNLDAPRISTCLERSKIEQLTLKKLGLVTECSNEGLKDKPAFWTTKG